MRTLAFFFILLNSNLVLADSSCWPESELIGQTAIGFMTGVNFSIFKTNESKSPQGTIVKGKCEIKSYQAPIEKNASPILCDKIQCFKGDCGGEGEHTILPIEESKAPFIQVKLKDEKKIWLKLDTPGDIQPILTNGKQGTLSSSSTQLLDSPNGKPVKIKSKQQLAYTVKKIIQVGKEEWAAVEVQPILNEEPPVKLGKMIGQGVFLFRKSDKKVNAVLSDIWCD